MPRDKKEQSVYDLNQILQDTKSPLAPYTSLGIDPNTGVPMLGIPEPTDFEQAFAKGLSPSAQPGSAQPKAMLPNEKDLGLPPSFLPTAPDQKERQDLLSQQEFLGNMRMDREKVKELLNRGGSGIDEIRQTISDLQKTRTGINLKPLAGFIDPWIGSNIAANLPDQMTSEQKAAAIAKLQDMASDQESKQAQLAIELLKQNIQKRQLEQSGRQSRFSEGMQFKAENDIQNRFQKEITNPLTDGMRSIQMMETNLASGNIQGLYDAAADYAKTVQGQKGVLSDSDIARALPTSLELTISKFKSWIEGDRKEPLDPVIIQNLKQGLNNYKAGFREAYSNKLNQLAGAYSKRESTKEFMAPSMVGGYLYSENKALLDSLGDKKDSTKGGAQAPSGPGGALGFEEWKASRTKQ